MKLKKPCREKIYNKETLPKQIQLWRERGNTIVFTNGVFDILHKGHLTLLSKTADFADILILGVNSDASVKRLKGQERPINDEDFRAWLLASLTIIDAVIIFEEDTPYELIELIMPDVLVKGGDYNVANIVGSEKVIANGGKVIVVDLEDGYSTTSTINKIKEK